MIDVDEYVVAQTHIVQGTVGIMHIHFYTPKGTSLCYGASHWLCIFLCGLTPPFNICFFMLDWKIMIYLKLFVKGRQLVIAFKRHGSL